MIAAVLLFARRIPREAYYALAAALALWLAYSWAYDRGVTTERAKWQAQAVKAAAVAAKLAQERDAQAARAQTADTERTRLQGILDRALQQKVIVYAQSENGRACGLDAAGVLLANEALAGANATVAASAAPRS